MRTIKLSSRVLILVMLSSLGFVIQSCSRETSASAPTLRLSTTTSTVDSGLFTELIPAFEASTGIHVEVDSRGSGAALAAAREGLADVVLVHSRRLEDEFVLDGYGINRRDVMYNDFVILGPQHDPANIRALLNVVKALKIIAETRAPFCSRKDSSGTYAREKELWKLVGMEPQGSWYSESKAGMLATLQKASSEGSYVLSDRSTFLNNKKLLDLEVLVEGDKLLFNPYGVIAVNPAKVEGIHFAEAMAFVEFLSSDAAEKIINEFGRQRFGAPLFKVLAH